MNCFQPPPVIQCCSLESRELSVPISPFIMMLPDYIDYLLNMVAGRCEALRVQSLIINLIILSQKFKFCHINLTITGSMHIAYFLFPFITKRKQIQTADPHKSTIIQFIKSHNWGSWKQKSNLLWKLKQHSSSESLKIIAKDISYPGEGRTFILANTLLSASCWPCYCNTITVFFQQTCTLIA